MVVEKQGVNQQEILGNVIDYAAFIAYQEGAVVSKTLIDKKNGTVTLFSFDKGQGLSEHTAPFDAFVLVVDGEVEVTIAGQPQRVKAGQMIIMPAHKPHSLRAIERFKMVLVLIKQ